MKTLLRRLRALLLPTGDHPPTARSASATAPGTQLDVLEPRVLFSGAPVEPPETEEEIPADTQATGADAGETIPPFSIADQTGSDQTESDSIRLNPT